MSNKIFKKRGEIHTIMKKLICLIIIFSTLIANAQKEHVGIKAGVNFANLTANEGSTGPTLRTRTSFYVGVLFEIPLSEKLFLQPELLYSGQGASFSANVYRNGQPEILTKNKFYLHYINIPVMLKYDIDKFTFIEIGPQLNFLGSAELEVTANGESGIATASKLFNKTDFGFNIGVGIAISKAFSVDVRYSQGLTNIEKETDSNNKNTLINSVISAGIVIKIQ